MATTNVTGRAVLHASFQLLRQDRQMVWLPVMATVTAVVCLALVSGPIALILGAKGYALFLALLCGSVVASAATIIFNVALVFAATERIEGRRPTVGGSLSKAWGRRGVIFQWALVSAIVGTVIRLLEQRLGLLGRLLGFAGGLAWVVATYLVIPVLAFEDLGPIEAVKRSSSILKARFGTIARSGLRFGALFVGASIAAGLVFVVGLGVTGARAPIIGIPLAVVGFVALIGIGMYATAAGMYMRTILYRFATDQPVPDLGVDLAGVFPGQPGRAVAGRAAGGSVPGAYPPAPRAGTDPGWIPSRNNMNEQFFWNGTEWAGRRYWRGSGFGWVEDNPAAHS